MSEMTTETPPPAPYPVAVYTRSVDDGVGGFVSADMVLKSEYDMLLDTNAANKVRNTELSGEVVQARRELNVLRDRVVKATYDYAQENNACLQGSAEFLRDALDISLAEAEEALNELDQVDVDVTVRVYVTGYTYVTVSGTVNRSELESGSPDVDHITEDISIDDLDVDDLDIDHIEVTEVEEA